MPPALHIYWELPIPTLSRVAPSYGVFDNHAVPRLCRGRNPIESVSRKAARGDAVRKFAIGLKLKSNTGYHAEGGL